MERSHQCGKIIGTAWHAGGILNHGRKLERIIAPSGREQTRAG